MPRPGQAHRRGGGGGYLSAVLMMKFFQTPRPSLGPRNPPRVALDGCALMFIDNINGDPFYIRISAARDTCGLNVCVCEKGRKKKGKKNTTHEPATSPGLPIRAVVVVVALRGCRGLCIGPQVGEEGGPFRISKEKEKKEKKIIRSKKVILDRGLLGGFRAGQRVAWLSWLVILEGARRRVGPRQNPGANPSIHNPGS